MIEINRRFLIISLIAGAGIMQFFICVMLAISSYAGGSGKNRIASGYSLDRNFLSDLGRVESWSGADNWVSAAIFNPSIVLLGLTMLPFFWYVANTLYEGRNFIRGCGLLSAFGLIGIGLTPYDRAFVAHHVALICWIGPMFVFIVGYWIVSSRNETSSISLKLGSGIVLLAILAYGLAGSRSGYVVMQKLTAGASVLWFALIVVRVVVSVYQEASTLQQLVEKQAEQYMIRLERGYRRDGADRQK